MKARGKEKKNKFFVLGAKICEKKKNVCAKLKDRLDFKLRKIKFKISLKTALMGGDESLRKQR